MTPTTMYDSVTVSEIPADAQAVAGYTAGRFPTFPTLLKKFPAAHKLSIAVASRFDADCLDIEPGDATNAVAAAWVTRQMARGIKKPVVYTSISNAKALLWTLSQAGIRRNDVRLWTAHYTHKPHICSPACGFGLVTADATQYTNHALGRNLDASLVDPAFFADPAVSTNRSHPKPPSNRKIAIWKHHLHEVQDVRRLLGPVPALKVAEAKLRGLIKRG